MEPSWGRFNGVINKLFLSETIIFINTSDKNVDFNARFDDVMAMVKQQME